MPPRLALAVFALAVAFDVSTLCAAPLDEWCAQAKLPSSVAICSDPQLRAQTIERQHAFDEARGQVGEERAPALLADQNAWVKSYPVACGLVPGVALPLPLAPAIRECMARAGQARIAYLRTYSTSNAAPAITTTAPAGGRIGPGFDCAVVHAPLALLICGDAELSKTDLRFNQTYQALRQSLDSAGRQRLAAEDVEFLNTVKLACGVPDSGAVAGSGECVAAHYNRKRSEWVSRLSGPALEEANRPLERHVALQADFQRLGFLPATAKIDGVYSVATRSAIVAWQNTSGRPTTGFIGEADAVALASAVPAAATSTPPRVAAAPIPPPPAPWRAVNPATGSPQAFGSPTMALSPTALGIKCEQRSSNGPLMPSSDSPWANSQDGQNYCNGFVDLGLVYRLAQAKAQHDRREQEDRDRKGRLEQEQTERRQEDLDQATKHGYQMTTFEDFMLDRKELARSGKKISLLGHYIRIGNIEWLLPSPSAEPSKTGVPLLTDEAPRELRKYFLNCNSNGCTAGLRGHAVMCERTILWRADEVPCLVVDEGWYRMGSTIITTTPAHPAPPSPASSAETTPPALPSREEMAEAAASLAQTLRDEPWKKGLLRAIGVNPDQGPMPPLSPAEKRCQQRIERQKRECPTDASVYSTPACVPDLAKQCEADLRQEWLRSH